MHRHFYDVVKQFNLLSIQHSKKHLASVKFCLHDRVSELVLAVGKGLHWFLRE